MPEEDVFKQIEKDMGSFQYVGEILATVRYHELTSVQELIDYYYKLWEVVEDLTDEVLQQKEDNTVEINPGGFGHLYVKGKKAPSNIDNIIESLRSQERYLEAILGALKKKYSKQFPKGSKFKEMTQQKP